MTERDAPAFRTFGAGARRCLAVHCSLGRAGGWRGLADALWHDATLIAANLPGHGDRAPFEAAADLHDMVTAELLPSLEPEMDLIGHSFGATVALRLAQTSTVNLRSVTLVEPVYFAVARDDAAFAAHIAQMQPFEAALEAGKPETAARIFNAAWGDGTSWEALPDATRRYIVDRIQLIPRQDRAIVQDCPGVCGPGRLEALAVPVLLVEGEQTVPVVRAIHDALGARLPDVRRVVIPGAGHMCPLTHPEEVAGAMRGLFEVT